MSASYWNLLDCPFMKILWRYWRYGNICDHLALFLLKCWLETNVFIYHMKNCWASSVLFLPSPLTLRTGVKHLKIGICGVPDSRISNSIPTVYMAGAAHCDTLCGLCAEGFLVRLFHWFCCLAYLRKYCLMWVQVQETVWDLTAQCSWNEVDFTLSVISSSLCSVLLLVPCGIIGFYCKLPWPLLPQHQGCLSSIVPKWAGVGEALGRGIARRADPDWPKGCSLPHIISAQQ